MGANFAANAAGQRLTRIREEERRRAAGEEEGGGARGRARPRAYAAGAPRGRLRESYLQISRRSASRETGKVSASDSAFIRYLRSGSSTAASSPCSPTKLFTTVLILSAARTRQVATL